MATRRTLLRSVPAFAALLALPRSAKALEQRDEVSFLRGPYNEAFYNRHNQSYRYGAAMHFFHSKQHDLLLQTPLAEHARYDRLLNDQSLDYLTNLPRTEPVMPYYSELTDRTMHTLFRAIDWTHMHHEQTYDILSDPGIPWADKKRWTDRAVRYYLTMQTPGLARSCAPLDVTMRRAAVMMKPYFTYFRNYYPLSSQLFYVAHWWHPAAYESQMIAGNAPAAQEASLQSTIATMWRDFIPEAKRPKRMVLSREIMPRYSRMSPESANIFDNLHMLHGIVYDCLAYPHWSIGQKRDELYRVIAAMSYQPGDEAYVRKFQLPHPEVDPRADYAWMHGMEGEMSRIMSEMQEEMMPMMMPGMGRGTGMPGMMKAGMTKPGMAVPGMGLQHQRMMAAVQAKMMPGLQPGEIEGSVHDAMMAAMPGMKMMPEAMEPGATPQAMVDAMLAGWRQKHGAMPDVAPLDMSREPQLPPVDRVVAAN
jgi:hypothetical protein